MLINFHIIIVSSKEDANVLLSIERRSVISPKVIAVNVLYVLALRSYRSIIPLQHPTISVFLSLSRRKALYL